MPYIVCTFILLTRKYFSLFGCLGNAKCFVSTYNCWRWNGARHKRPMSSIVLQPGVKDMIINDCKDFLASEAWYVLVLCDKPCP